MKNENVALIKSNYDGITASDLQSRSLISNHGPESRISPECDLFFERIENSIIFAVTKVLNKSCNLIDAAGSSEFELK